MGGRVTVMSSNDTISGWIASLEGNLRSVRASQRLSEVEFASRKRELESLVAAAALEVDDGLRAIKFWEREIECARERRSEMRRAIKPKTISATKCSECGKRDRHFGDYCKRCASDLGFRPTGKVGG